MCWCLGAFIIFMGSQLLMMNRETTSSTDSSFFLNLNNFMLKLHVRFIIWTCLGFNSLCVYFLNFLRCWPYKNCIIIFYQWIFILDVIFNFYDFLLNLCFEFFFQFLFFWSNFVNFFLNAWLGNLSFCLLNSFLIDILFYLLFLLPFLRGSCLNCCTSTPSFLVFDLLSIFSFHIRSPIFLIWKLWLFFWLVRIIILSTASFIRFFPFTFFDFGPTIFFLGNLIIHYFLIIHRRADF